MESKIEKKIFNHSLYNFSWEQATLLKLARLQFTYASYSLLKMF